MSKRQPSTREIRRVLEELQNTMPPLSEGTKLQRQKKILEELAGRFPNLSTERLGKALEAQIEVKRREALREKLSASRMKAVLDFLTRNMYANLEEAADDLGLLSLQEVWDLVMDEAKLPLSDAPETIEIK